MDIIVIFFTPVLLVAATLVLVRVRRLDWVEDVGLRWPAIRQALGWLAVFGLLMAIGELVSRWSVVPSSVGSWQGKYDSVDLAIRLVAVPLVYPICEELFFRGALLGALIQQAGAPAGVLLSSAIFALIHIQYDAIGMMLIAADALLFAICRTRTGSLYLVMLMHVFGNSYAVWERLL